MKKYNAVIGQSGGPTSVINSSLLGVILRSLKSRYIDKIYGMKFGIEGFLKEEFGYRGEFQITESLVMSAIDRALAFDIKEAFICGKKAVELAEKGESGYMITIERVANNPYRTKYGKIRLNEAAIKAKPMPLDFINKKGNFVTDKFYEYIKPLVNKIPFYGSNFINAYTERP